MIFALKSELGRAKSRMAQEPSEGSGETPDLNTAQEQLIRICMAKHPPLHDERVMGMLRRWDSEVPPKSPEHRLKVTEAFDQQEAERHRHHVQAIVRTGRPDPKEKYRYEEYLEMIIIIEKETRASFEQGQVPGFAGCPSRLDWPEDLEIPAKGEENVPPSPLHKPEDYELVAVADAPSGEYPDLEEETADSAPLALAPALKPVLDDIEAGDQEKDKDKPAIRPPLRKQAPRRSRPEIYVGQKVTEILTPPHTIPPRDAQQQKSEDSDPYSTVTEGHPPFRFAEHPSRVIAKGSMRPDVKSWLAITAPRKLTAGMTPAAMVRAFAEQPTPDMFNYERGARLTAYQVSKMHVQS